MVTLMAASDLSIAPLPVLILFIYHVLSRQSWMHFEDPMSSLGRAGSTNQSYRFASERSLYRLYHTIG